MPLYEWSPALSVGLVEIDDQHKQLLDLINELHVAMKQGRAKPLLLDVVASLQDYVKRHFSHEERLMRSYAYPDLADHKELHRSFIDKVATIEESVAKEIEPAFAVARYLTTWYLNHIAGVDMQYAAHIRAKRGA